MNGFNLTSLRLLPTWLWEATWQASLLAGLILIIQWLFRTRLSARWLNALWLLVVVRLLLPVLPAAPFSAYRWLPGEVANAGVGGEMDERGPVVTMERATPAEVYRETGHQAPDMIAGVSFRDRVLAVVPHVWWSVFLLLMIRTVAMHRRWWKDVLQSRGSAPPVVQRLFDEVKSDLRVTRVELVVSTKVSTPLVTGFLRAKVLLPAGMESKLPSEELRMVLWHELTHVKRGDTWLAWLSCLAVTLHWFNPMVRLALRHARDAREMACDESVLGHGQDATIYGSALVRILELGIEPVPSPAVVAVGICETKSALLQRVRRIAAYRQSSWLASVGGGAILTVLGLATLTSFGDEKRSVDSRSASPSQGRTEEEVVSTLKAFSDFVIDEEPPRLQSWSRESRNSGGGSVHWPEKSGVRLSSPDFKFAIEHHPGARRQGTGDYAPCPPALYEAIDDRNVSKIRYLLRDAVPPNLPENDVSRLLEPIEYTVRALILKPEDTKLREVVKVLLEYKADPYSSRIDRRSLFYAPVAGNQVDLVRFLLAAGIDPRKAADGGAAVLQEVGLRGSPAMKALIQTTLSQRPDRYGASKLW